MKRLSAATVADAVGVEVPGYDRSGPSPIVHLGVGAFARAHLAVYADDLLRQGHPTTIRGVSLRSPRAAQELGPQDGWFTVTTREPASPPSTRLVGSVTAVESGPAAAVEAIAAPTTRLVTLTITENGYEHDGPDSTAATIAAGLDARRTGSGGSVVVASLDNLLDNGSVLRDRVDAAAAIISDHLPAWIDRHVAFPRSVVDRMVPAATAADLGQIASGIGLADHAAVVAEAHRSWVIETVEGLPPLDAVGVEVVDDIEPHQRRKLWLLNGPHSALAYVGLLAGCETIAAAATDPRVAMFVSGLVDDVLAVVPPDATDPAAYAASSLARFANPDLGHTCAQVAADGSRKLPQRVVPVMELRRIQGRPTTRFAFVIAVWLAAVTGTEVAGASLPPVADPAADELRAIARERGVAASLHAAFDLHPDAVAEVLDALGRITREGVRALEVVS